MNTRFPMLLVLAASMGGCAAYGPPPQYGHVVTMKAGEAASVSGYPPPGTVWRLDPADLKAMSPAPIAEPPPPPRRPPPSPMYYPPPPPPPWYYGPPY